MLIAASVLAVGFSLSAAAQTAPVTDNSTAGQSFSSSTDYRAYLSTDALFGGSSYAEPAAGASASPQYGGGRSSSYPSYENKWSHIAFEGGFGFSIPIGNDTSYSQTDINDGNLSPSEGLGYGLTVGGGWNFTKKFGALLEYRFLNQSIPSDYLNALSTADAGGSSSTTGLGGNINTWSFTIDPIYYVPFSRRTSGVYVTGGGGFYQQSDQLHRARRKLLLLLHLGAGNGGPLLQQSGRSDGASASIEDLWPGQQGKFFARPGTYASIPQRPNQNSYGIGTEEIIPVTFGIRF